MAPVGQVSGQSQSLNLVQIHLKKNDLEDESVMVVAHMKIGTIEIEITRITITEIVGADIDQDEMQF